ncbi:MAG TPA: hypothetical protein H9887_03440 [Candidatus Dorea intestinavium]|nr:hypothetical protein [Candidatus Dorea intestinavium]
MKDKWKKYITRLFVLVICVTLVGGNLNHTKEVKAVVGVDDVVILTTMLFALYGISYVGNKAIDEGKLEFNLAHDYEKQYDEQREEYLKQWEVIQGGGNPDPDKDPNNPNGKNYFPPFEQFVTDNLDYINAGKVDPKLMNQDNALGENIRDYVNNTLQEWKSNKELSEEQLIDINKLMSNPNIYASYESDTNIPVKQKQTILYYCPLPYANIMLNNGWYARISESNDNKITKSYFIKKFSKTPDRDSVVMQTNLITNFPNTTTSWYKNSISYTKKINEEYVQLRIYELKPNYRDAFVKFNLKYINVDIPKTDEDKNAMVDFMLGITDSPIWVHPDIQKSFENNGNYELLPPPQLGNNTNPNLLALLQQLANLNNGIGTDGLSDVELNNLKEQLVNEIRNSENETNPDPDPDPEKPIDPEEPTDPDGGEPSKPDTEKLQFDLSKLFPFCIPFDLINFFSALSSEPEPMKFDIPIMSETFGIDYTFHIDMSIFNSVAVIFRLCIIMIFIFGLIVVTRSLIKG